MSFRTSNSCYNRGRPLLAPRQYRLTPQPFLLCKILFAIYSFINILYWYRVVGHFNIRICRTSTIQATTNTHTNVRQLPILVSTYIYIYIYIIARLSNYGTAKQELYQKRVIRTSSYVFDLWFNFKSFRFCRYCIPICDTDHWHYVIYKYYSKRSYSKWVM